MSGQTTSIPSSPVANDLESRTGKKVERVTISKDKQIAPVSNLQKMNLPDKERKRVETHQQNVKQNVLVPRRPQNPKPPVKPNDRKDDKK
jgi:hypothetical protein